jgi:hypothetical protein
MPNSHKKSWMESTVEIVCIKGEQVSREMQKQIDFWSLNKNKVANSLTFMYQNQTLTKKKRKKFTKEEL